MKAVITNRIYLEASRDLMEALSSKLTYKIPPKMKGQPVEYIKTYSRINDKLCSIPSGRFDLIPKHYEIIDKRILNPVEFPDFTFTLRDSQQEVYDLLEDSCIINASPSWGKTFTGLAIAKKLGQKTLVVTHTTMLRDQWVEEIEKVFKFKPDIIGSQKYGINTPIVVANVQTLIKYINDLSEEFGTLILDEAHHVPANTFSSIVDKSKARYKIGLTATLQRKDGKHIVFTDYFGPKVFKPEKENYMKPSVVIVDTDIIFPGGKFWANRITELEVHNKEYQRLIAELADSAASKGYKVLVVGSRTEFLKSCTMLSKRPAEFITGEIKNFATRQALLKQVETDETDIIYGTLSIFSEGISQSSLSCLILATPINNDGLIEQVIGRICREKEGKKQPLIIDINLIGSSVKIQQRNRMSHYLRNGYTIRKLKK